LQDIRKQLDQIGFHSIGMRSTYIKSWLYKHTQWIFIQLFNSWYNKESDKAEDIITLIAVFEKEGILIYKAVCDDNIAVFCSRMERLCKDTQEKICYSTD
jgi:leucyl-tRNA synthetase